MRTETSSPTEAAILEQDLLAASAPGAVPSATGGDAAPRSRWLGPTAQKGALALFDQAVVSGTSFATSVVIARLISRDALGVYYPALSIVLLVQGFQERLISTPYTIYCSRRSAGALAFYTGSALLHHLALSAVSILGLLGFWALLTLGIGPAEQAPVIAALLGALPLLLLRGFLRLVSMAHLHVLTATLLDMVVAALQLGGFLALWFVGRLSVPAAYLVMGGACAAASVGWFLARRQPLRFAWSHALADWQHNWSFAKWVVGSNLAGSVAPCLVPWILVTVSGKSAAGLFGGCATLVGLLNVFVAGLDNFVTSKAARAYRGHHLADLLHVLRNAALVLAAVLGAMFAVLVAAGGPIARLVYGPEFASAGPVVALLAATALVTALGNTPGKGLWVMEHPRANLVPDILISAVTLVVLAATVYPLDAMGAAIAGLAGALVGGIVRFWTFKKLVRTAA
jgi:O-antigen/teichoic acid export membrane protein